MSRRIRLTFVREGVAAEAILLDDRAPQTCAALWDALPTAGASHHATYSGSEAVLVLPELVKVAPEHPTADVEVGDVAFTWFDAGSAYGVTEPFSEIAWFYDRDASPSMHEGPAPMTVFARIEGDVRDFYAVCRRMRREGVKALAVERVEEDGPDFDVVCAYRPEHGHAVGLLAGTAGAELVAVTSESLTGEPDDPRSLPVVVTTRDGGRSWHAEPCPRQHVGTPASSLVLPAAIVPWSELDGSSARVDAHVDDGTVRVAVDGRAVTVWDRPGMPAVGVPLVSTTDDGAVVALFRAWDGPPGCDVPIGRVAVFAARIETSDKE